MESGVDPTVAAALPLVGVVLGVLLGVGVEHSRRRSERRDVIREATRLLRADLLIVEQLASLAAKQSGAVPRLATERLLQVPDAWVTHRPVLARNLPDEDWERLVRLVLRVQQLQYGTDAGVKPESLTRFWALLAGEAEETRQHLSETDRT